MLDREWTESMFHVNEKITPNYGSLLLISGLLTVVKYPIALKLFHLIFVVLFAAGFYFWNRRNDANYAYFLVLPLVFSSLFLDGFYNFVLATAILFFILGYYEKTSFSPAKKYVILSLLLLLIYFCHSIVFAFAGLSLAILEICKLLANKSFCWTKYKPLLYLFLSAIPCFILAFSFMDSRESTIEYLPMQQLIDDLIYSKSFRARSEVSYPAKYIYTALLLAVSLFILIQNWSKTRYNYLLITAIFCLGLYFIIPNSVGYASVFSVRVEYFFWIFLTAWICRNPMNRYWQRISLGIVTSFFVLIQISSHNSYWKLLNKHAILVLEAKNHIPEKAIIYPVFSTNYWEHLHISNLLGLEKDFVILENNGARNDYFVTQYNEPYETYIEKYKSLVLPTKQGSLKINYLVKIGKNIPELPNDIAILAQIQQNGKLVFENELIEVWKSNY